LQKRGYELFTQRGWGGEREAWSRARKKSRSRQKESKSPESTANGTRGQRIAGRRPTQRFQEGAGPRKMPQQGALEGGFFLKGKELTTPRPEARPLRILVPSKGRGRPGGKPLGGEKGKIFTPQEAVSLKGKDRLSWENFFRVSFFDSRVKGRGVFEEDRLAFQY